MQVYYVFINGGLVRVCCRECGGVVYGVVGREGAVWDRYKVRGKN